MRALPTTNFRRLWCTRWAVLKMMMIAFITFKSSLVPLFEGLWSANSWELVYTDVDHFWSTFGGTIDIDICSTFAGLPIDIDIFWSPSLIFRTFSRENAWKMSLCVNIWFCIFQHMILGFLGFLFRVNRYIFDISTTFAGNLVDIRHRHLQTSDSTSVYTLSRAAVARHFALSWSCCTRVYVN